MHIKKVCKLCIDIEMLVITVLLMVSERTGIVKTSIVLHMFLGVVLFVLFIIHNILNLSWWAGIGKGTYSVQGGSVLLLITLTSVLGYSLKTAVGMSTFIMTFAALTGAVSHIIIGGTVNVTALVVCVIAALVGARASVLFANKVDAQKQNRVTGVALCGLGAVLALVNWL